MDSILNEINMLPGVFGCFVYSDQQKLIGAKLPPIFKENTVNTIGNLLTRTLKMGSMTNLDISGLEFKFDVSLLIIKPIVNGTVLAMICEPGVNRSLVKMTLGMLLNDLQNALLDKPASPRIASPSASPSASEVVQPQKDTSPTPPQPVQQKKEKIDAALTPFLEKINEALAYTIGPIAEQIMQDIVETWTQNGPASKQRLPDLANLLCKEINDKNLEKEFMDQVSPLF
jgi:hypothetical protein